MNPLTVVTGATGFLGSHILSALLEKGEQVIVLGRASQKASLEHRVHRLLKWFGMEDKSDLITIYEADFLMPFCGLSDSRYEDICQRSTRIIHCASDTRFSSCFGKEIRKANVDALNELIGLAENSHSWFCYISTAYAAGLSSFECLEELPSGNHFTNIYEETKAEAERMVAAHCSEKKIPWTIIRPSIVYGNSVNGRSNGFNALYSHVKSLYFLKEIYQNDIRKNNGKKSAECGIGYDEYGRFHMPLKVYVKQNGLINLIPVDYFATAVMAILRKPGVGRIYNITSNQPRPFTGLADWCEKFLNFKGINILFRDPPEGDHLTPAEALLNKFIEPYLPYLSDIRIFDRKNTDTIFPVNPPDLTYEVFHKCMEYAIKVKWNINAE